MEQSPPTFPRKPTHGANQNRHNTLEANILHCVEGRDQQKGLVFLAESMACTQVGGGGHAFKNSKKRVSPSEPSSPPPATAPARLRGHGGDQISPLDLAANLASIARVGVTSLALADTLGRASSASQADRLPFQQGPLQWT